MEGKYELNGHRYMGKIRKNIPTEIEVKGEQVHVSVRLKRRKVQEYQFAKNQITNVSFGRKFVWYMFDIVLLVMLILLSVMGIAVSVPEILSGTAAIALISYGFCARCQHLIITLNTGAEVCIPVSDADSANDFLQALK